MKKSIIVPMLAVVGIAAWMLFAQEQTRMNQHQQHGAMMSGQTPGMCPMHKMMGQCMMSKQMIALDNGEFVVLVGNQLFKYDQDLELEKEVTLPIDMAKMQQKMKNMTGACPMCQKMMNMEDASADDVEP